MKKGIARYTGLLVTLMILLVLVLPALPAQSADTGNLVILPSAQTIRVGETLVITVQAQCGSLTTDGIDTYIDFDPTYLSVQSATEGTTLSTVLIPPTWNNTEGSFGFSAGQLAPPFPSGTFKVVTITLLAKSGTTAPTAVTFHTSDPRKTMVDWEGNDITGTLTRGTYSILISTTTTLTSSVNPASYGQSIIFTATVSPIPPATGTPTGTITFMDGATVLGTWNLSSGQASCTTSALSTGSHSITAVYNGDGNYDTSTSSAITQDVNQGTTSTIITSSDNPSVYSQSVTFTATVSVVAPATGTPTGTVTFKDGNSEMGTENLNGSGLATYNTSTLFVNSHPITAVYNGDNNYVGSTSSNLTQEVREASTTITLTSPVNPSTYGQLVTFNATVSAVPPATGTPTGTISFMDGATVLGTWNLSSGQASCTTSAISTGSHSITAIYSGDGNHDTSTSSAITQDVNQGTTSTIITSSDNPSVYSQSVTFTATVSAVLPAVGTPTGTVTFKDGTSEMGTENLNGSGLATYNTSALSASSHPITAVYNGDNNYVGSTSSNLTQEVREASTTITVTSLVNPSSYSQMVTFNATVSAVPPATGTPTGTISFMDGATVLGTWNLSSGQTSCTTSALSTGSHSITAVYNGDGNYDTSTSSAITQDVNQGTTSTIITSSDNPSVYSQSVTFTATVSAAAPAGGTPTGTVTFKDGISEMGTENLNGSGLATYNASALSVSSHPITAVYNGDNNYVGSTSSNLTQEVREASTTITVTSLVNPSTYGQLVTFNATVSAVPPATGTPTGTITFMDGATALGTWNLSEPGQPALTTSTLSTGSHSITAVYGGDNNFTSSTSSILIQTVQGTSGGGGGGGGSSVQFPTVTVISPADQATGVAIDIPVKAVFSKSMNASTLTTSSFTLKTGDTVVSGAVKYDLIGSTATFTPSANLAFSTTYTATLTTAARDTSGYALGSNRSWSFTTQSAPTPVPSPTISSPTPSTIPSPTVTSPALSPTPAPTTPGVSQAPVSSQPPKANDTPSPATSPAITSPPAVTPVPSQTSTPSQASTNWGLITGIIAGVAIIILAAFAIIRIKGVKSKS